jgi:hypothetical protein
VGKKYRKRDPCTHCDEGINTTQFNMENTQDRKSNLTTATEDLVTHAAGVNYMYVPIVHKVSYTKQ